MKKALLAMMIFAGSLFAGPRFSVGIGFGAPAVAIVRPACPGPGYVWVDGYYAPTGVWSPGFWRAPFVSVAVGPRFFGPGYPGYGHVREYHRDFHR